MEDVRVLGLILALALGLVSLALAARIPQRLAPPDVTWLPVTLLLYNLWIAAFLAAGYIQDHVLSPSTPTSSGAGDAIGAALLALSLAWLYAFVTQVFALLGIQPSGTVKRVSRSLPIGIGLLLAATWGLSLWTGNSLIFHAPAAVVRIAIFPAAIAAAWFLFRGSRRFKDEVWRALLSGLAVAYIALFSCLMLLSLGSSVLAGLSPDLPVMVDLALELAYNGVAIVWLMKASSRLKEARPSQASPAVMPSRDWARLLSERGVTKREAEIVELICLGRTNQEIADQLFIALTTVKDHNYVIFQKLAVRNRTELTRLVLGAPDALPK